MSIQAIRERVQALNKEANNLLANKGDAIWSAEDKKKWDELQDEAERGMQQIEAHEAQLRAQAGVRPKAPAAEKTQARAAVELFLRTNEKDYTAEKRAVIQNTMSTTTGSEGGFTVPALVATELINALKDYGAMRRVAKSITTTGGNDLSYPTTDGTAEEGEIVAQNAQAADADPDFGTAALNVFKFGSKTIAVPIELLQDSNIDIVAMVNQRVRDRIGRIANRLFTVGTGSGQPFGLITRAGAGKTGATGQTTTVIYDDLVDLVDSVDVSYLEGDVEPAFMFRQATRRIIRKIKDTAGRPIWTPSYDAGAAARTPDRLLGYPVVINNDVPAMAANAKSIAFGQLGNYMIRDTMQVTLFRFEDSAYIRKGQIGFLAWARMGGNLLDASGVKVYVNSAT